MKNKIIVIFVSVVLFCILAMLIILNSIQSNRRDNILNERQVLKYYNSVYSNLNEILESKILDHFETKIMKGIKFEHKKFLNLSNVERLNMISNVGPNISESERKEIHYEIEELCEYEIYDYRYKDIHKCENLIVRKKILHEVYSLKYYKTYNFELHVYKDFIITLLFKFAVERTVLSSELSILCAFLPELTIMQDIFLEKLNDIYNISRDSKIELIIYFLFILKLSECCGKLNWNISNDEYFESFSQIRYFMVLCFLKVIELADLCPGDLKKYFSIYDKITSRNSNKSIYDCSFLPYDTFIYTIFGGIHSDYYGAFWNFKNNFLLVGLEVLVSQIKLIGRYLNKKCEFYASYNNSLKLLNIKCNDCVFKFNHRNTTIFNKYPFLDEILYLVFKDLFETDAAEKEKIRKKIDEIFDQKREEVNTNP